MQWQCKRCKFGIVEVKKETLFEIVGQLNPNFLGLPEDWQSKDIDYIPICPRCNSHPLGIDMEKGFPVRTRDGETVFFQDLPYVKAHQHSDFKQEILKSDLCGCFYCLGTFKPSEIDQWMGEDSDECEATATCPECGIDSVIGSESGYPIEKWFLEQMKDFWFSPSELSRTMGSTSND